MSVRSIIIRELIWSWDWIRPHSKVLTSVLLDKFKGLGGICQRQRSESCKQVGVTEYYDLTDNDSDKQVQIEGSDNQSVEYPKTKLPFSDDACDAGSTDSWDIISLSAVMSHGDDNYVQIVNADRDAPSPCASKLRKVFQKPLRGGMTLAPAPEFEELSHSIFQAWDLEDARLRLSNMTLSRKFRAFVLSSRFMPTQAFPIDRISTPIGFLGTAIDVGATMVMLFF